MTQIMPQGFTDLVLGTDLIEVARLKKAFAKYGQTFFAKMLTQSELDYCFSDTKKTAVSLHRAAGRIAIKEAVSKALGTGLNGLGWGEGIAWHEVEVVAQPRQAPKLKLHGTAKTIATQLRIQTWRISLAHDGGYATGTAIGLITSE